jgi:hypothetical protein
MSESGSDLCPLFGAHGRRPTVVVHCEGGFGRIAGKRLPSETFADTKVVGLAVNHESRFRRRS